MAAATRKATAKSTVKTAAKKAAATPKETPNVTNVNDNIFGATEDFTAAAREQFETMMTSFSGNMEGMREQAEELADDMRQRMEKTQQRVADVNAELMEAARTEMTDAVQFANELAQAKTLTDALDVQRNYWTNLFETRMQRAREMTEASVEAAREAVPTNGAFANSPFGNAKAFEAFFPFSSKA